MKKLILILGALGLCSAVGLRAYFGLVPPPEPTLERELGEIFPEELPGWSVKEMDMANSPEAAARVSDFLNFDDSVFRIYTNGQTMIGLYIAYWKPGKVSYRWAGAHTPDTCWVQAGWERKDREFAIPFHHGDTRFEPAEFGVYEKDNTSQNVYFWHLVGGDAFRYDQVGNHNIFGSLVDVREYGLNLREEQFFIRVSSNRTVDELKELPGFSKILEGLAEIGLKEDSVRSGG